MARLAFNSTGGGWSNLDKPGGRVFFVGGGTVSAINRGGSGIKASDKNDGLTPERPLATIDGARGAHNKCVTSRGDTIVLLPGSVTITAAMVFDSNDITLTGIDPNGTINPSAIIVNGAIDGIAVTGANVVIENLHFPASTASATSRINAGSAGLTVRGCTFECGANDAETITVNSAGDDLLVENCRFYITANGPEKAIEIEAVGVNRLIVRNCSFTGGTNTNKWDTGAINSAVAHTNCLIDNNTFYEGIAIEFSAAATGIISRNLLGEGFTLGDGIDPGSCMCFENYEADAIDQSARIFPATIAS
jgi:hypothetical protein